MKLATFMAACVIAATGVASAAPTYADAANPLFARELSVLVKRGMTRAHASRALAVQSSVAKTQLVGRLEAELGGAWGGAWFDPATAQLHVGVASDAGHRKATVAIAAARLSANVEVSRVRFSWGALLAAQKRWNSRLASLFAQGQVKTALDAERDALIVTLSASVAPETRAQLARAADGASVRVILAGTAGERIAASTERETTCNGFVENAARCNKPITSGVTIESTVKCTAGPLVIPAATKLGTYVLTAGHCIKLGGGVGEKWFAFNRAGTRLEIGEAVAFEFEAVGDFADIRVNEPGAWAEPANPPTFAITKRWNLKTESTQPVIGKQEPVKGMANCHEGQTTGESCGTVGMTGISVSLADKEGEKLTTLEGLAEDEGSVSAGGDSGGPWLFVNEHQEIFMEGTHVGKSEKVPIYMPLKKTLEELKMELLTTANEVRPANPAVLVLPEEKASELVYSGEAKEGATFETTGKKAVKCTGAKVETSFTGSETKASQGTTTAQFTGCKQEKTACSSENSKGEKDVKETILATLDLKLADEKNGEGTLESLFTSKVLPKGGEGNLVFVCGVVKGEVKGIVPCLASPSVKEVGAKETVEVTCKQKEGKQETGTCQEAKATCEELKANPLLGNFVGKFESMGLALRIPGSFNKMALLEA